MSDEARLKELYRDLYSAGSLAAGLQEALVGHGSRLKAEQLLGRWYANVTLADRRSQVMIAAEYRSFSSDFWHRGVSYGHIWDPDLKSIAAIIANFVEERASSDMRRASNRYQGLSVWRFRCTCVLEMSR